MVCLWCCCEWRKRFDVLPPLDAAFLQMKWFCCSSKVIPHPAKYCPPKPHGLKASDRHLLLVVISVLQRYKTDFSTSIGWYINIISVNEITVFNCKFKLKP